MKIVNWNVGRPSKAKGELIVDKLNELNGDIIVLTETNSNVIPDGDYNLVSTLPLFKGLDGIDYQEGEIRSAIWTKYSVNITYETYDQYTSVCADILTPYGVLTLYATIIGVFGGKGDRFKQDLENQYLDFAKVFADKQGCIIGDFNTAFTGFAYPSLIARQKLNEAFDKFDLTNLTSSITDSVDHIAVSSSFMIGKTCTIDQPWNMDKKLSDHLGYSVTILER